MSQDRIKIRLPNARQKLQPLFPEDNRGDVRIVFNKKTYKLQKAFLRLQSGFFKKTFAQATEILQIKQDFNDLSFANVLKCFYGFTIEVPRTDILDYYPIVKYLQVESLLKVLRQDMNTRPERYDVFVLLQLAHRFSEQQLFETCLGLLQKEGFQQMKTLRASLLRCPGDLFKMLVKTHNRHKSERTTTISYLEIDQLIRDFSQLQKLTEPQYQQLKFELIDKKCLSSQEYKQIFLDEAKKKGEQYRSMMRLSPDPNSLYGSAFNSNIFSASKLTESVIEPIKKMNDELALELENTYQKKKNEELTKQNAQLATQLIELKNAISQYAVGFEALKALVAQLQAKLEEKDRVDKEQTAVIKKLEKTVQDMKTEATTRSEGMKKLEERVGKLEKQPQKRMSGNPKYIPYDEEEDQSKTIQSQIVPGHLLKDFAKPAAEALSQPPTNGFKKAKSQPQQQPPQPPAVAEAMVEDELDQDDLQDLYSSRLEFDREPQCCRKNMLPRLANYLTSDGFQKKKLRLLYRRIASNQQSYGQATDIRGRDSLLFLICTRLNVLFGGFISVEINKNSKEYLSDENAFLFSLTKNEKCPIRSNRVSEAVFVNPGYLIGFSNDVMISLDPIRTQSHCAFPDAYEDNKNEPRTPRWLCGQDASFSIKAIEIYEVSEEEMIMDL